VRSSSFAVLKALADGRLRSGPEIAAALDIARTTVSHAMRELEAHGLAVHAVRGSGYRLAAPFDALDVAAIGSGLGSQPVPIQLEVMDECESTNAVLADRAAAGAPSGTAVVCELQRAGRGRRGAGWYSGLGTSLTLSVLWRFGRGTSLSGLPLAIGVACARALEALGVSDAGLKWPNDIVRGDAKLGGILVEVAGDGDRSSAAVIGVGINVRLPDAAKRAIGRPVADLGGGVASPSRNALAAGLLAEIAAAAAGFEREGFGAFRDEWLRRHAWQGRRVRVLAPSRRTVDGVAAGVADDGALIVETTRGPERFHSAEVSLKLAA